MALIQIDHSQCKSVFDKHFLFVFITFNILLTYVLLSPEVMFKNVLFKITTCHISLTVDYKNMHNIRSAKSQIRTFVYPSRTANGTNTVPFLMWVGCFLMFSTRTTFSSSVARLLPAQLSVFQHFLVLSQSTRKGSLPKCGRHCEDLLPFRHFPVNLWLPKYIF